MDQQQQQQQQQTQAFHTRETANVYVNPITITLPRVPTFSSVDEVKVIINSNKKLKIHAGIAIIISSLCLLTWAIFQSINSQVPFFLFPICFFLTTLSFHYFIFTKETKEYINFHFSFFAIVNVMVYILWAWEGSQVMWFLYVFFGWGMFLAVHASYSVFRESPHRKLYTHLAFFTLLNCLIFVSMIKASRWFPVAFFSLAIFPLIHWSVHYHPRNRFMIHLYLFFDIQFLIFFVWLLTARLHRANFPWFIFPLALWSILLFIHYKKTIMPVRSDITLPYTNPVPTSFMNTSYSFSSTNTNNNVNSSTPQHTNYNPFQQINQQQQVQTQIQQTERLYPQFNNANIYSPTSNIPPTSIATPSISYNFQVLPSTSATTSTNFS